MLRQLSYATRMLAVAATFALPTVTLAQADNRPVVVVYTFTNSAMGAGSADFAGITTGVQDLLITELASNRKFRVVDRSKINEVLAEQKLTKDGAVDPQTAIRLGKIMGAQYAITGGWMTDTKGTAVLTARSIDIETTQIANPQKINGKTENVLDIINQLAMKVSNDMSLAAKTGAPRRADAAPTTNAPAQSGSPTTKTAAASSAPAGSVQFAHEVAPAVVEKTMKTKLDVATMKLYSNALDEMDKKNKAKALDLFNQVLTRYPDFEPAQRNKAKLA